MVKGLARQNAAALQEALHHAALLRGHPYKETASRVVFALPPWLCEGAACDSPVHKRVLAAALARCASTPRRKRPRSPEETLISFEPLVLAAIILKCFLSSETFLWLLWFFPVFLTQRQRAPSLQRSFQRV